MPSIKDRYDSEIVPTLMKEFGYSNIMQVPKITKVVVNMGLGEAVQNPKVVDSAVEDLRTITGQQPIVRRARRSIAGQSETARACLVRLGYTAPLQTSLASRC